MKNNFARKQLLALGVVCGLVAAGNVAAQDCATPIAIHSNEQDVTADTCGAGNPLPTYGGTGSPQNEVVYSFVAQAASATIAIAGTGGFAGTVPAAFLFPACSAATDPIAFGVPGTDMVVENLTDGQTYYVAVTADPGGTNDGCGAFDVDVTGTLPVTLTGFSVE